MTLEPLHPDGRIRRVLVLGSGAPAAVVPRAAQGVDSAVDMAVIAPSPAEARARGWLTRAAGEAVGALAPRGFVYALVPRGRRGLVRRQLQAAGLVCDALAQLPDARAARYLVPLRRGPWRYALGRQIEERPWARRALLACGGSLAGVALPAVGIVARRPGDPGPGAWLERLDGTTRPVADLIVTTSWRGPDGALIAICFGPEEERPWGVAKLAPAAGREAEVVARLGEAGGARVPRLLARGVAGQTPVLVETLVEGTSAANALARDPGRLPELTAAVAGWLERWNGATIARAPGAATVQRELLGPAADLAPELPEGYRDWLAMRVAALGGGDLPLVARHNDLTMWNVRLDAGGPIGVLDWADADEAGLPLTDLFYAVADATAACDGYHDRVGAARRSLEEVSFLRERLRAALGLTAEAAELCLHACWLRHARNEARVATGPERPFLEIARWVARRALERSP